MSKILVTGASGLLGFELCTKLMQKGHEVWALDNLSRSTNIPPCSVWLLKDLMQPLSDIPTNFDYIFHYGAINGTSNFYKYPNKVLTNNFICDINIFNFALKCENLSKIVYASSSEIVADDLVFPSTENTDILIKDIHNPRWSYRLAKITSENYLVNSDLPYVIFRYFNVYGRGSREGHFVADQIKKIKKGIFSVTGAYETRSFCHVSDAAYTSIKIAELASKEIINIGNDTEIKIIDAATIIANCLGHDNPTFDLLQSVQGSVSNRRPDITKLRSYVPNYEPISFKAGIQSSI